MQLAAHQATSVEVVTVYDPNPSVAQTASERFGVSMASSYEALLQHNNLEAVVLVSPNPFHRAQAEAAFAVGLDVLVEKPIANTIQDGLVMIRAAEAAERLLMVGHNMRRGKAVRRIKELLDEHAIGTVVSIDVDFSSDTGLKLSPSAWRLQADACPLLPMMQLGIHCVDLVHYFFSRIERVVASARSIHTTPPVIDSLIGFFHLEDGTHGTLTSNYCTETRFVYRIAGTEGTLFGTPHSLQFTRRDGTIVEAWDTHDQPFASYIDQMQVFGETVHQRHHPETDGWGGLQALAVVEAMQTSLTTGHTASVSDVRSRFFSVL